MRLLDTISIDIIDYALNGLICVLRISYFAPFSIWYTPTSIDWRLVDELGGDERVDY